MKMENQLPVGSLTVTGITRAATLYHKVGRVARMRRRPGFGFSLAVSGKIVYRQDGRELLSEPGRMIFYSSGADYDWECAKEGQFTLLNFTCLPTDEIPFGGKIVSFPVTDPDYYLNLHRALERAIRSDTPGARAEGLSLLYRFLSRAVSDLIGGEEDRSLCRAAADYMERHFSNPSLSVAGIAADIGLSEPYFRSLFRERMGISPGHYLQQIRLRSAEGYLTGTDYPVGEVAALCGYASLAHFSRLFREKYGITPSEYRRSTPLL